MQISLKNRPRNKLPWDVQGHCEDLPWNRSNRWPWLTCITLDLGNILWMCICCTSLKPWFSWFCKPLLQASVLPCLFESNTAQTSCSSLSLHPAAPEMEMPSFFPLFKLTVFFSDLDLTWPQTQPVMSSQYPCSNDQELYFWIKFTLPNKKATFSPHVIKLMSREKRSETKVWPCLCPTRH